MGAEHLAAAAAAAAGGEGAVGPAATAVAPCTAETLKAVVAALQHWDSLVGGTAVACCY